MDSPALEPESAGIQPITAQGSAPVQVALSPRVALVHAGGCSVAVGSGWAVGGRRVQARNQIRAAAFGIIGKLERWNQEPKPESEL